MRRIVWVLALLGCDAESESSSAPQGGTAGTGGIDDDASPSGGAAPVGGASPVGGDASVGGAAPVGGDAPVGGSPPVGDRAFTLRFDARHGAMPFRCDARPTGLGVDGAEVEPLDFRMYVHDVRFITATGDTVPASLSEDGLWQYQGTGLLDFEDKTGTCENGTQETRTVLQGRVLTGDYVGVAFTLGVPFELNHADAALAPSPLNLSGLFWNWNGGYKFLRADARVLGDAEPSVFNIHLGSTGCTADAGGQVTACARPNRAEVRLDPFDPETQTIVVDYAALVAGSTLGVNGGGPPGCMSGPDDPECPALFERLGLDLDTGASNPGQSFITVE